MQRTREEDTSGVGMREGRDISRSSSRVLCIPRLNAAADDLSSEALEKAELATILRKIENSTGSFAESVSVVRALRLCAFAFHSYRQDAKPQRAFATPAQSVLPRHNTGRDALPRAP